MRNILLAILIAYAALGGFLFGYDLGCITGALPLMLNDTTLELTDGQAEMVVAHCKVGAAIGAIVGVWLLRTGHMPCFYLSGILYIVGPLLIATASGWVMLSAGRLAAGLAVGLSAVASPTYLADVAPARSRGCIVGLYELSLTAGMLTASLINLLLQQPFVRDALATVLPRLALWRLMLGLPSLPAVPFFFGCLFLPESPVTLITAGHGNAAFALLLRLHGEASTPHRQMSAIEVAGCSPFSHPVAMMNDVVASTPTSQTDCSGADAPDALSVASADVLASAHDVMRLSRFTDRSDRSGSFAELPLSPANDFSVRTTAASPASDAHAAATEAYDALVAAHRLTVPGVPAYRILLTAERRAALLMLMLAVTNQASGSTTVLNYVSELLASPAFATPPILASALSTAVAAVKLACVLLSALLVDRCGRRPLLLLGAALMTVGLLLSAWACHAPASTQWLVAGLVIYVGSYALSLAPIFFTLLSELFSPTSRPLAAGIATAVTFSSGGTMDACFLSLRDAIGYEGVFYTFAAVSALGGICVLLMLPETKGATRTEIQMRLATRPSLCCAGASAGDVDARAREQSQAGAVAQHLLAFDDAADELGPLSKKRSSSRVILAS